MKIVTYRITLLEPALVTSLEGDPNSAVAHDYLPGSVLRGVIIGLHMRKANQKELKLTDSAVRRRFFDGSVRFLNAYLVMEGQRSLPAPRSWEQDKHAEGEESYTITDRALSAPPPDNEERTHSKPPGKPKSLGGEFCKTNEGTNTVYVVKPQHIINVHTERNRKKGRSLGEGQGTIYRYDALASEQVFEAMILCDQDEDAKFFVNLFKEYPEITLGGARSAGYGRARLSHIRSEHARREVIASDPIDTNRFTLTLLSDVILRDTNGQYMPDADTFCQVIVKHFGLHTDQVTVRQVFKSEGLVGGFNRKWGLPLPQMPTLTMGSVFVLTFSGLDADQINALPDHRDRLEWSGVGERRAEGFGRIVVDWQRYDSLTRINVVRIAVEKPTTLNPASAQLWDLMKGRIQRQHSDQQILEEANKVSLDPVRTLPPKTQINRLRQIVTSEFLKQSPNMAAIIRFLNDIAGKKAAKAFSDARVNGQPMDDWLKSLTTFSDSRAALRLIDAVLARAAKLRKQEDKRTEANGG